MTKRMVCRAALLVVGLLAAYVTYTMLLLLPLRYLDDRVADIHAGDTRKQVQRDLSLLRESKVGYNDIPAGYRDFLRITPEPGYTVYRYDLVHEPLSVHIVYDERQRVVYIVPTYE